MNNEFNNQETNNLNNETLNQVNEQPVQQPMVEQTPVVNPIPAEPVVNTESIQSAPIEEPKPDLLASQSTIEANNQTVQPQQAPVAPQPMTTNNNGSNKFLIILIAVLSVIAVAVIVVLINKNSTNNASSNEYEEGTVTKKIENTSENTNANNSNSNSSSNTNNNSNSSSNTSSNTNSNTNNEVATSERISLDGISLAVPSGFQYKIVSDGVMMCSQTICMGASVDFHDFDDYVAQTDGVKSYLETVLKFTVSGSKVDTYNGIKILSFEVSNGTEKGFYYLAQPNISSTTIMGVVENANATLDYSMLNKVAEVVKSATVEGGTFSTKVSKKIKLANLTMKKPN